MSTGYSSPTEARAAAERAAEAANRAASDALWERDRFTIRGLSMGACPHCAEHAPCGDHPHRRATRPIDPYRVL